MATRKNNLCGKSKSKARFLLGKVAVGEDVRGL